LAWKQLKEKYAPKIAPRKVELMKEFQRMSLKSSSEDLDVWLTKLELSRVKLAQMSYDVTKEQMIIHMLNNLLEEYDIQVSKLESRLDDKANPLTISEIWTKLNSRNTRIKNKNGGAIKKESGTEQALVAFY